MEIEDCWNEWTEGMSMRVGSTGFGDLQADIQRRPSAGPNSRFLNKAVSGIHRSISGRASGGRPLIADDIVAKVDSESKSAGAQAKAWGWGSFI
jgi:hypothetical protein